MPASWPAGTGLPVDRHQPHEAHQPTYPLLIHQMTIVAQVPGHLPDAEEGVARNCLSISRIKSRFCSISLLGE